MRPELAPVLPEPGMGGFPLAYAIPKYEEDLLSFTNTSIEGRIASGLIQEKAGLLGAGTGCKNLT